MSDFFPLSPGYSIIFIEKGRLLRPQQLTEGRIQPTWSPPDFVRMDSVPQLRICKNTAVDSSQISGKQRSQSGCEERPARFSNSRQLFSLQIEGLLLVAKVEENLK